MEITEIPFHHWLGIERAEAPFIYEMNELPVMLNHVGSIHACIQLSLAEASAGEFLKRELPEYQNTLIPVVRKTEAKYAKPANGKLFARVNFYECTREDVLGWIANRERFQLKTQVQVTDANQNSTLKVVFEWFVVKMNRENTNG